MKRFTMRVIDRDAAGAVAQVIEQEIPATVKEIECALRRKHFRLVIAYSLLRDGQITIEASAARKIKPGL